MNRTTWMYILALVLMIMAGCGSNESKPYETASDLRGKILGGINTGTSEKNWREMAAKLIGGEPKEVLLFDRTLDAIAALKSGKIDGAPTYQFCADYIVKRNPLLKSVPIPGAVIEGEFIMVVRSEDQQLKQDLDKAITALQQNGTLKSLEEQWITNLPVANEMSNAPLPKNEKQKTIYVGVSGDYVPLDYISAEGHPSGYNVAIFNEMAKLIPVNFEFVSIETQARFAALSSKKIDVIFVHAQSKNTNFYDEFKNNKWLPTLPYYTYKGGCIVVKKAPSETFDRRP
jgi:ABC-type amino acid transport substrate-binding protein